LVLEWLQSIEQVEWKFEKMTRLRSVPLLIMLVSTACRARVEPTTQLEFADTRSGQLLVGVGARRVLGSKVFGLGLYVDRWASKTALSEFKGCAPDTLASDFYETCTSTKFAKTLVLKMKMDISGERMARILAEPVKRGLPTGSEPALNALEVAVISGCARHTGDGRASPGTTITLGVRGASLGIMVNGRVAGTIRSRPLCKALVSCYLDDGGVTEGLRSTCGEGLLQLL
jgi:hypothetical protein